MRARLFVVAILIAAQASAGCALAGAPILAGATIGAVADIGREQTTQRCEIEATPVGTRVHIRLRGGQTMDGRYQGEIFSAEEYVVRYAAASGLPALQADIAVRLTSQRILNGRLVGFEPHRLILLGYDGRVSVVALGEVLEVSEVSERAEPVAVSGPFLIERELEGRLPYRSCVRVSATTFPLEAIEAVEVPYDKHAGIKTGVVIGLVVDALAIAALATLFRFQD